MKFLVKDVRFWIIFFFLIRLWGITNPPLEVAHNWRQTTVTMAARNFLETDTNILYPRIDIAGEKSGITGMEFPLLNYLIYLISSVFGYQHWYGRLINLVISSFGLFFFSRLITKYFDRDTAFYATIILAVSIWFQYSRKIMPDTFSVSLVIAGLWYGCRCLDPGNEKKNIPDLAFSSFLLMIGVLSKIPSVYLLIIFIPLMLRSHDSLQKKSIFSIALIISMIPAAIWYFYWVPHLVDTFGFRHFFMGKGFSQGVREIMANLPQTFERFYDTALKYSGFLAFLGGLIYAVASREKRIVLVFIICLTGFILIMIKSGFNFPHHSYYIIPFVPVMALVAGFGLSKIRFRWISALILFIIVAEGIANQQHDFRIKEKEKFFVQLSTDLDKVSDRKDLFLINSDQNPTPMYFAHRKGWVNSNEKITDTLFLEELKQKGCKYILVLKRSLGTEVRLKNLDAVIDNENFCLYKLPSSDCYKGLNPHTE